MQKGNLQNKKTNPNKIRREKPEEAKGKGHRSLCEDKDAEWMSAVKQHNQTGRCGQRMIGGPRCL